jgi:hypothetical protein
MTAPDYGYTYHYTDVRNKINYHPDLDMTATALHGTKNSPLQVRLDASWGEIDDGSLNGKTWIPNLRLKKVDEIFTKVLRPDDKAILILATHSPPSKLNPHLPFQAPAQWRFPDAANNFVEGVVKHIAGKGWLDRVVAWQISDEPNNLAFSNVAAWDQIVKPLNMFLHTIRQNDTTSKPRIINMYQIAPSAAGLLFRPDPWDELFNAADKLQIPIGSNFEIMGADIYPDQWVLDFERSQDGFQKAVSATVDQLNRAKQNHGFQGNWGILEMAGGPRAGWLPGTLVPTAQEIADYIAIAKQGNPAMIVPFQIRGSTKASDVTTFYGHSYGLIDDESDAPRTDYLGAIQNAV